MIPQPPDHYTMYKHMDDQTMPGEMTNIRHGRAYVHHYDRRRKILAKWSQVITWSFFAVEITLGFRVMLKLIAANPLNQFTEFIYQLTRLFVAPFSGLTVTPDVSGAVLEISSIIGMIVYAVLYWLIIRLMWIVFNPTEPSDATRYEPDL